MSISASIDISWYFRDGYRYRSSLVLSLLNNGWKETHSGCVMYLPLADEDYSWERERITRDDLLDLIDNKESRKEIIGVTMYYDDSNRGLDLLIYPDNTMSFVLSVNRVASNDGLTDFSWYLDKIIPAIENVVVVTSVSFDQG